jgi:hypothetical protein
MLSVNLYPTPRTKAKVTNDAVTIETPDGAVRIHFPHADARALAAVAKTVNFALRFKDHAANQPFDRGNPRNPDGGEIDGIQRP